MKRAPILIALAAAAAGCAAIAGLKDVPGAIESPDASPDAAADASELRDATPAEAAPPDAPAAADAPSVPDAAADAGSDSAAAPDAPLDGCAAGCGTAFCINGSCVPEPPSCQSGIAGVSNCGAGGSGTESCCTSIEVDGGNFYRSYDGVTYTDTSNSATVSAFRLDKYEVTVGRFRPFVNAVVAGWLPPSGSGIHTHLNGGKGLAASPGTGYELGWDISSNSSIPTTLSDWNTNLACAPGYGPWTAVPGTQESEPIDCVTWAEAYAFCIWDGGFLPSEAEWNFAASGGSQQRAYPWSNPATSTLVDCSYANYEGAPDGGPCVAGGVNNVGSESPKDLSRWGHADLGGNVTEWVLDWFGDYGNPCKDCVDLVEATDRRLRGGLFSEPDPAVLLSSARDNAFPTSMYVTIGVRCARVP